MTQKLIATIATALALAVMSVAPAAAAEQPNQTQYGNAATSLPTEAPPPAIPEQEVAAESASTPPAVASTGETLPFTGLDLGIVLAFAVAAIGGGLMLRHVARKTEG